MADELFAGPVDYLVFAFDAGADLGAGLRLVFDRVQQGTVEVLDLELVGLDAQGSAVVLPLGDAVGIDLELFDGVQSHILDEDDLAVIAEELREGQVGLAVVYEDRSLAAAAGAWAQAGGREILSGGIAISDLDLALQEGSLA